MKTKQANKLLVLVISLMMIVTLLAGLSITANAEETGTETTTPSVEFAGKQVNLGGDISMKFHVRINDSTNYDSIRVDVEFLGKVTSLTESVPHPNDTNVRIFTFEGINPQCMGDPMNVTLHVGGMLVEHEKATITGYTVEKNFNDIYNDCTAAQKQLIDDLRAYGKASEVYTGHTSMTGTNYTVREIPIPASSIAHTDTSSDISVKEVNVRFGSMNYLMFKFEFTSETATDLGDKVKIDGKAPADAYIDGNYYVVISEPISPENFHKDVVLTYDSDVIELSYSINDYCRTLVDGDYAEEMETLAQALYNYGLSAHIVVGNHEGGTATCAAQAVCTVCGNGYGNLLIHNYTYTANDDANTITESCDQGCGHSKTITLKAPANLVFDGYVKEATVDGALDVAYELSYSYNANPVNIGTYTATLTAGGKSVSLEFAITKATPTVTAPTANTITYNGDAQALVSAGATNFGTMVYSLTEDGTFTETIPTGTNAGEYTVYYYVKGGNNVNDSVVASVKVTIAKANPTFTAPTANTITYNGATQNLVIGQSAIGGEMQYFVGDNASTNDSDWSADIPGGKDAGDYKVWWRVKGDANHSDIEPHSLTVTISPITITADMITVNSTVYNGSVQTPNSDHVTVIVNGSTLVHNTDFYIGVSSGVEIINADTYNITVVGQGNYTGSVETTFTIEKATPTYTAPTGLTAIYGQTLADVDLPEGWEWQDADTTDIGYVRERTFKATYTPTDTNYKAVTDIEITITVVQDPDTTEFDGEWVTVPTNTEG